MKILGAKARLEGPPILSTAHGIKPHELSPITGALNFVMNGRKQSV